jgi:GNAT superfamily N-acetyltransferase
MSEIRIRPFKPEDLQTAQDISVSRYVEIYAVLRGRIGAEMFEQVRPNAEQAKRDAIAKHAEEFPECFVIAEDAGGQIIGFATYRLDEAHKVGIIGNNAVRKDCGLKGVGQALYAELFRRFREAGMTAAQVMTGLDEGHAPARRAYQRAGFDPVGIESVVYYKKL